MHPRNGRSVAQSQPAIVGFGFVGRQLHEQFPLAVVYDEPKSLGIRDQVNAAPAAFVCVPTPQDPTGYCDTSIVERVVAWLDTPLIILRSTVPPGTTDRLRSQTGKRIVFQPEFAGMTPGHPYAHESAISYLILGGHPSDTADAALLWQRQRGPDLPIYRTTAAAAELTKYAVNAFLATKVTFANELASIAAAAGVEYADLRDLFTLDPRIGRSHTAVDPADPGFGGDCLPKDLAALLSYAEGVNCPAPLLSLVEELNLLVRNESETAHERNGQVSPSIR